MELGIEMCNHYILVNKFKVGNACVVVNNMLCTRNSGKYRNNTQLEWTYTRFIAANHTHYFSFALQDVTMAKYQWGPYSLFCQRALCDVTIGRPIHY